jgi:hypothetical protein
MAKDQNQYNDPEDQALSASTPGSESVFTDSPLNRKDVQRGYKKADSLDIHADPYKDSHLAHLRNEHQKRK